ncbi:GapA-binding peptide SR1P [Paenibacillus sp. GCM10027627]|uniref:GapA-binding peptide SR1P n=1 Tax=unclassified Paenibacillus TaxID=185978 RepID=UPI003640168E
MKPESGKGKLGIIICKHCNVQVETVDTNRISTFYGVCDHPECRRLHGTSAATIPALIEESF